MKAAIVDQLGAHYPNQEFLETAESLMRQAGFGVDIYGAEKVTVNLYGSLSTHGYKLIVFRVHAGVDEKRKNSPVGLFTVEPYSELAYPQEQLAELVEPAQAFNRTETVFGVTPKFIRERTILDYDGAVIILTGCFGLYSRELPQAFIDRGASVVIGWNGLIDVKRTDMATSVLLRMMLAEKMSVGASVSAVMREVGADAEYASILSYYPQDRGDLDLNEFLQTVRAKPEMRLRPQRGSVRCLARAQA